MGAGIVVSFRTTKDDKGAFGYICIDEVTGTPVASQEDARDEVQTLVYDKKIDGEDAKVLLLEIRSSGLPEFPEEVIVEPPRKSLREVFTSS